jgi:hypothetical protein
MRSRAVDIPNRRAATPGVIAGVSSERSTLERAGLPIDFLGICASHFLSKIMEIIDLKHKMVK